METERSLTKTIGNRTGPQTEPEYYGRTPDQDIELWKHYASFGGQDKNRMVGIASWLLGFSGAIFWYTVTSLICFEPIALNEPLKSISVAALGIGVSVVAGYISLLYGGYANRNWAKADQIARRRGWKDLLPPDEPLLSARMWCLIAKCKLYLIAKRWARPCKPEEGLPPVFIVFLRLSVVSFAGHFVIAFWSLAMIVHQHINLTGV